MSSPYPLPPLAQIIRPWDRSERAGNGSRVLVPIPTSNGDAVTWLVQLVLPAEHYLVVNALDPYGTLVCDCPVQVHDVSTGRTLSLVARCQVRCNPGQEETLARAFHDDPNRYTFLENCLWKWVHQYAERRENDVVSSFLNHREPLVAWIIHRAQEVGFALNAQLFIREEASVAPVLTFEHRMHVGLADRREPFALHFRVSLEIGAGNSTVAHAMQPHLGELDRRVAHTVAQLMPLIHLAELRRERDSSVRDRLWRQLDIVAHPFGRRVVGLWLDGELALDVPPHARAALHALTTQPLTLRVEITPRGGGLTMWFDGEFFVTHLVEEHHREFLDRLPRPEIVSHELSEIVRGLLSRLSEPELLAADALVLSRMIEDHVKPRLRQSLGLEIKVTGFQRRQMAHEEGGDDLRKQVLAGGIRIQSDLAAAAQDLASEAITQRLASCKRDLTNQHRLLGDLRAKLDEAVLLDSLSDQEGIEQRIQRVQDRIASLEQEIGGYVPRAAHTGGEAYQAFIQGAPRPALLPGAAGGLIDQGRSGDE